MKNPLESLHKTLGLGVILAVLAAIAVVVSSRAFSREIA